MKYRRLGRTNLWIYVGIMKWVAHTLTKRTASRGTPAVGAEGGRDSR